MLRIGCWKVEKNLKTTPCSDCALNALAIDEPLEYARLYLDGTMRGCGLMQKIHFIYNDYTVTPNVSRE